jgi:polysaccharide export outer membrane protein
VVNALDNPAGFLFKTSGAPHASPAHSRRIFHARTSPFFMISIRHLIRFAGLFFVLSICSCTFMSQTGPQKSRIEGGDSSYVLVAVNSRADLPAGGRQYGAAQLPPPIKGDSYSDKVRERDTLRFIISDLSEQSPFYTRGEPFNFGPVEVPRDGRVGVPYVGAVQVLDRSLAEISAELLEKLKPISNTAQSSVSRSGRIPKTANVLGEVKSPGPVNLERGAMDSLDLLSAAGGPKDAEHLFRYTLRRGGRDYEFDYEGFRKCAFPVEEGDLLSVTTDASNRFYVMGAINRPITIPFPAPSPSLADALGAASGLDERRSDPSGVFVFRKGDPDRVYTINLKEPGAILLTQRFAIQGEDIVYVTEAPLVRWSRLIQQIIPLSSFSQAAYDLNRIGTN